MVEDSFAKKDTAVNSHLDELKKTHIGSAQWITLDKTYFDNDTTKLLNEKLLK